MPSLNNGTPGGSAAASARASPALNGPSQSTKSSKLAQVNSNGYHPANSQKPLSSLSSPALDLSSVERRGQPIAAVDHPKRSRIFGLEECPTYRPTEEEFKDPFEYVKKIRPEAVQYGLCKIIPPGSWNPEFAIDTERFHFITRKQELNSCEGSTRANLSYLDALAKFHKQQGNNLNRLPYVDKKPLDLYRLKKAVESRGGFDNVCKQKKWAEIGRDLGYSGKIMSSLSTSLKNSYQKWLCPYEEYLRVAKPGVHQRLENEYGGPFTPSPAPSPMKRSNVPTPSNLRESPARHATETLQATVVEGKDSDMDTPMQDSGTPQQAASGGFRAINSFTAFNKAATTNGTDSSSFTTTPKFGSPLSSAKNTPDYRPSGLGPAHPLKRQHSTESLDIRQNGNGSRNGTCNGSGTDKDDGDSGSRRSKRLKKDTVPTVAGSHMSLFRPSAPRIPKDEASQAGQPKCEHCGKADGAPIIVCESCDNGYHGTCLDPPLKQKPDSEWNCPRCLVGDGQFGFEEGGRYSLKQFQEKAANFKAGYFESRMPYDPILKCHRPVTEDDVEREFWRLVSSLEETVEVEYGADIHCTTHGSGFPTIEKNPDNSYSTDSWNLNILPLHPDSLYRYIKSDVSGMTVPWVYVGMTFSTFCWHNEDHYSYSANYQHFGATKTWYGIPGADAVKFEKAMKEAVPELFETQPDLLFQLVTLLPPEQLKKAGVHVYALDQHAGEFVITFPQAYHAGFNHGFNFNEAVNFAPSDWEPFGLSGVDRLQEFRRQPCFSHDEMLWTAAEGTTSGGLTIQTAKWLYPALRRTQEREWQHRILFHKRHAEMSPDCSTKCAEPCSILPKEVDEDVPEEEYQCSYCKGFTYLSRFKCHRSGKVMCLLHGVCHPCCDATEQQRLLGDDHTLIYRKSNEVVDALCKKVSDKAHLPDAWEEKYLKLLDDEAIPSLKALRNVLNEGEKIPWPLKSLPNLKVFVERCNHWVDEAVNYTARKQQNRRKNDKGWQIGVRRSSSWANKDRDEADREMRDISNIHRLLEEAELIGFDCPEIGMLRDKKDAIREFQESAKKALKHTNGNNGKIDELEDLLDVGRKFSVDIPEVDELSHVIDQLRWNEKCRASRGVFLLSEEVEQLVEEGEDLKIPPYNDNLHYYKQRLEHGRAWEETARELISAEVPNYSQLEALSTRATQSTLPISSDLVEKVDRILYRQREAQEQIRDLNDRSRNPDPRKRPQYLEVADLMKRLEELGSKPPGAADLEKEQKRHEDWMRKGKKLFGKSNAPLHILKTHMEHVLEKNVECFELENDKPRLPAEPASRDPSPSPKPKNNQTGIFFEKEVHEVFCICRRSEAGLMIECELCHEWYHAKCLKVARGKVKEEDKYTCPICDWRVKIPRDAARPKLEDLMHWYDEIPGLPFQPEEESVLDKIITNASDFRKHVQAFCNPMLSTPSEAETQRFYLRKIEGAEILLANETNFFRQELHKWSPVAPDPPPILEESKSTRKPRPTKLQRILNTYGVEEPDQLPESIKAKAHSLKRKSEAAAAAAAAHAGGSGSSTNGYGSQRSRGTSFSHPGSGSGFAQFQDGRPTSSGRNPMSIDNAMVNRGMFVDGGLNGPEIVGSDTSSLEDKILSGEIDVNTEEGKRQAAQILSRSGRRLDEILGPRNLWDSNRILNDGTAVNGNGDEDNAGDVDKLFVDLTNAGDDEDDDRKPSREDGEANGDVKMHGT
ncbi:uncharacterized protein MKZ38_001243 [Zalerion maritima]|uniref:Uncharacterized protein n=1 Tax=Zalerion maritima TaxID=339359 RepID=A0AAD5WTZ3_9PEZI|nr:uncharacterized protein MKZ38_001243 [Zalerion maritima]